MRGGGTVGSGGGEGRKVLDQEWDQEDWIEGSSKNQKILQQKGVKRNMLNKVDVIRDKPDEPEYDSNNTSCV